MLFFVRLWSFLVARSDTNHDRFYSVKERSQILSELGINFVETAQTLVPHPLRNSLASIPSHLHHVDIDLPRQTIFTFSSMDGYAHFDTDDRRSFPVKTWPTFEPRPDSATLACIIEHVQCFSDEFFQYNLAKVDVNVIFRRLAFEEPRCGDCIIVQLLGSSGLTGFESFLPPPTSSLSSPSSPPSASPGVDAIALVPTYATANFTSPPTSTSNSPRSRAVALIARYSYVFGDSASVLVPICSPTELYRALVPLDRGSPTFPAFLALNDDVGQSASEDLVTLRYVEEIDVNLKTWFEKMWANRTRWEKGG